MVVEALLLLLITREQPLFKQNHLKQVYCDISESFCNYVFRFFVSFCFTLSLHTTIAIIFY